MYVLKKEKDPLNSINLYSVYLNFQFKKSAKSQVLCSKTTCNFLDYKTIPMTLVFTFDAVIVNREQHSQICETHQTFDSNDIRTLVKMLFLKKSILKGK